jgi:S-adenosylmethionine:tRNA ribosyltransferase-isomerase
MLRSEFHYELPEDLIARHPPGQRSDGRLLHVDGARGSYVDRRIADLPELLRAHDLLVVNDTRVVPARLWAHKATGGRVEIMLERVRGATRAKVQLRASKAVRPGAVLTLADGSQVDVLGPADDFWEIDFRGDPYATFERLGEVPLPPYLERAPVEADRERYQTVYARERGAVAAPTAGLHFDEPLLERCRARGADVASITLHVGAGTFQPVRVDDLAGHRMHAESIRVEPRVCAAVARARRAGGRTVAVGTTVVRALETAARPGALEPFDGDTRLFIVPGYRFRVVDALLTNFHLPESTLLMLVAAFAGRELVLEAYRHAVTERYRFFSYGDAMFVEPAPGALAARVAA